MSILHGLVCVHVLIAFTQCATGHQGGGQHSSGGYGTGHQGEGQYTSGGPLSTWAISVVVTQHGWISITIASIMQDAGFDYSHHACGGWN